ncbi:MAG TPA: hypothetical protein PK776_03175 [Flavobacterium sp.]|nr:hypothetical protein [Flavobacterium sp.]
MALNKKNKRSTSVDGKEYLWRVIHEYGLTIFDGLQIKAVCTDQTHFITYGLQQKDEDRKLALGLKDNRKMIYLSSPPKFENSDGIITKTGINRMLKWCKQEEHHIQNAWDGNNNILMEAERQLLLKELQKVMD